MPDLYRKKQLETEMQINNKNPRMNIVFKSSKMRYYESIKKIFRRKKKFEVAFDSKERWLSDYVIKKYKHC